MTISLSGFLTLFLISASCTMVEEKVVEEKVAPPQDFSVRYEWKEASIPPPHHYEITIVIGPGGQGKIDFLPDYPSDDTPVWSETFEVPEEELAALFARSSVMRPAQDERSSRLDVPSVGGQLESLTVTYEGESFHLSGTAPGGVADLVAATRSLVPETVWKKLMGRRELYIAQRSL